jgi:hypothetical protein
MKVVWSPSVPTAPSKTYKNVWYRTTARAVWMDPTVHDSIESALGDREETSYKRIAILEFQD